jgi:bifunctional non-homologous end joining protein LigD
LRFESRNGNDITPAWPELAGLAPVAPGFVVDGEIVVEVAGRSSFRALAPRMHLRNPATIAALAEASLATFMIFDLLHIGDRPLTELPYTQHREVLELIGLAGLYWRIPGLLPGPAADALAASKTLGAEWIICKRRDSWYLSGQRNLAWTKVKNVARQEVVVVGPETGAGRQAGMIGSLRDRVPYRQGVLVTVVVDCHLRSPSVCRPSAARKRVLKRPAL